MQALNEGGLISWATFVILVTMSIGTFYILFTKFFEQQKIISQGNKVRSSFWNSPNLREASSKLDAKSAYRAIVDDTMVAQEQHGKLTNPVDQHDWMANSLARSQGGIGARLGEGLAFLATVGSTAPFIGLFGTVVGIYRALIKIGASGQASISTVAGPVGEALIMTALGLVVAVPAVLAYNWLIRRNKSIMEDLAAFTNDLHGYVMSEGKVKPADRRCWHRQCRFGFGRQGRADPFGRRSDPGRHSAADFGSDLDRPAGRRHWHHHGGPPLSQGSGGRAPDRCPAPASASVPTYFQEGSIVPWQ